ncbi:MAG: COQ9 family protein [Geminicoccaceae bacterium]
MTEPARDEPTGGKPASDAIDDDAVAGRVAEKDAILEAALGHAAFDGWSRRTLLQAASEVGIDKATARRLFPQGGDSLLAWLDDWADRKMLEAAEPAGLATLPVRQRIATLIRCRLEVLGEHKEALRRAAVARGTPRNLVGGGRAFWRTLDRIWEAAGFGANGGSRGFSYYSRRTTLGAVLTSTFLYWLEDHSPGHADSWAFLDRRIENVMRFGQLTGRLQGFFDNLPGAGFLRRAQHRQ